MPEQSELYQRNNERILEELIRRADALEQRVRALEEQVRALQVGKLA